jgi:hypothetical protein
MRSHRQDPAEGFSEIDFEFINGHPVKERGAVWLNSFHNGIGQNEWYFEPSVYKPLLNTTKNIAGAWRQGWLQQPCVDVAVCLQTSCTVGMLAGTSIQTPTLTMVAWDVEGSTCSPAGTSSTHTSPSTKIHTQFPAASLTV